MSKNKKTRIGKTSDLEFNYVLKIDPELDIWRGLAAAWFDEQLNGRAAKRLAIDKLLTMYLPHLGPNKALETFFQRSIQLPPFKDCLQNLQKKGLVKLNNHVHDFFDWVLLNALTIEDDNGHKIVPAEFHNPVQKLKQSGIQLQETVRTPLPFRYIKELRDIICPEVHFSDWKWAHQTVDHSAYGDWFEVDPLLIDKTDPDCVWRKRTANVYNQGYKKGLGGPYRLGTREIHEIWSPVRAMVIYLKLELPLRTFQVRMLDS